MHKGQSIDARMRQKLPEKHGRGELEPKCPLAKQIPDHPSLGRRVGPRPQPVLQGTNKSWNRSALALGYFSTIASNAGAL